MTAETPEAASQPPFAVPLEGVLVKGSLATEAYLALARKSALRAAARLIAMVVKRARRSALDGDLQGLDPKTLAYDEALVAHLRAQKQAGARFQLVTAQSPEFARAVSKHLGVFESVATVHSLDVAAIRPDGSELRQVEQAPLAGVDGSNPLARPIDPQAASLHHTLTIQSERWHSKWRDWRRLLRLHQWMKNFLIFVPLVVSQSILDRRSLILSIAAFAHFSAVASATYIINDLVDLAADRLHPRKRNRPIASGRISALLGIVLAPAILVTTLATSVVLMPSEFTALLVLYVLVTFAYSAWLKQIVLVDVVALASLYTLRIIAGAAALRIAPSFWLLAFSMFIFLSLALIKRFTELLEADRAGKLWIAGRGYRSSDLRLLMSLGTSSGYTAVLVLALYINSTEVTKLYGRHEFLWLLCPVLLYWIARMWMQAERANMHDDPLVFAAKDRVTYALAAVSSLAILAAAASP